MATQHGFCPFALNKDIPPGANDPSIVPRAAILHVDAGNAFSLFDFFKNRSGGIESHFHIRKDGVIEQYRSIYRQADANLNANDFAISIETQGLGEGEWNGPQLASIKRLLLWLNAETEGAIPLRKITLWNGKGIGYHTLFGAPSPWTPVAKSCPGPDRKAQFHAVLVPWFKVALKPEAEPLRIVTHNVSVKQPREKLRRNLERVVKRTHRPHVIALQEAKRLHRSIPGYQRVAVDDVKSTEAGQNVLLVRNDVKILRKHVVTTPGPRWRGPHLGKMHDPRIFVGVSVAFDGQAWDILNDHRVPGGAAKNRDAWKAEGAAIEEWAANRAERRPGRPLVIVGDKNANAKHRRLTALARDIGGRLLMAGIDGAVVRGCKGRVKKLFRKFGSDTHRPVVLTLTKES